jgi:hypothetical protein
VIKEFVQAAGTGGALGTLTLQEIFMMQLTQRVSVLIHMAALGDVLWEKAPPALIGNPSKDKVS